MAVATGMAGEEYVKTDQAVTGMERIKEYLSTHPSANFHQKAMLLWAAKYHKGLIERPRSKVWIEQLFSLQNADGGWSSADLVQSQQGKAKEKNHAVNADSDGYGSGFVIYVLRTADVAATDTRIKKGVAWLKNNQRTAGYWWTQSMRNMAGTPHYLTNTGTAFAIKAVALSAEDID
jgi:squalene-hopene/tetraprenyl-beta-curcumene cyclase